MHVIRLKSGNLNYQITELPGWTLAGKYSTNGHHEAVNPKINRYRTLTIGAATVMDESEVIFELPANNPRKKANPISKLFLRYVAYITL